MNTLKKLFILGLATASTPVSAGFFDELFLNPYVAVEAAHRDFSWETSFGERHFRENFGNINFIGGVQIHEHVAIEGGFQTTDRRDKQEFYTGVPNGAAEPVLGFIEMDPADRESSKHISQAEVKGAHLNLVGLYKLLPKTTAYASIGLAWMKFYVNTVPTYAGSPANRVSHWRSNSETALRLGIGVKQFITPHFGARVFANWENTSGMEGRVQSESVLIPTADTDFYKAKAKNSYLVGLGFFYQLCPGAKYT